MNHPRKPITEAAARKFFASILLACGILAAPPTGRAAVITDVSGYALVGMQQVYALDIPNTFNFNTGGVPYTVDNSGSIPNDSYSVVAYYMELQQGAGPRYWVWASFDLWNSSAQFANRIGVPNAGTTIVENGTLVNRMSVESNHPGITTGNNFTGIIEFWASNYGQNGNGQYGSSNSAFDWKDSGGTTSPGHGSMQIFNITTPGAEETLFGFNGFNQSGRMGIGTQPGNDTDWTFGPNASTYSVKRLEVWVGGRWLGRQVPEPTTSASMILGVSMLGLFRRLRREVVARRYARQYR